LARLATLNPRDYLRKLVSLGPLKQPFAFEGQEGEMARVRQDQEAGVRNGCRDIFGVRPFDRLVMVAVDDEDWRVDRLELIVGPVRLTRTCASGDRLPRGFGVKRLMDLPMAWSDQWSALGLKNPAQATFSSAI
jgi:hypothetical protein